MDASMCSRPSEDYGAQKAPWGTQARRSCHSACYWFSAMQRKPCPPLARTPAQHERTHAPPPAALPEPDQPPVGCVLGTVTCVKGPRLEGLALGHAVLPSEGRARALRRRADQERRHGRGQQRQRGHRSSHPSCCHVVRRAPQQWPVVASLGAQAAVGRRARADGSARPGVCGRGGPARCAFVPCESAISLPYDTLLLLAAGNRPGTLKSNIWPPETP